MKKLLYNLTALMLTMSCVLMISSCGNADKTSKTIDNLQEYLPNVQSKVIFANMNGSDTIESVYKYTYDKDNRVDWSETDRTNGKLSRGIFGYDYYDRFTKELKQNITSDNSPIQGDYTVLINKVGKNFKSYDGMRTILSNHETVTTPYGTFDNCIYVKVENDEGLEAYRYYAPNIGYVYGIAKLWADFYYENYMSSYVPLETITYDDDYDEIEEYEDNVYRWYLTKKTFENTDDNHTLNVEVAGDTLRFTVDGQFIGTASFDETDYFPDYNGYTTYDTNGEFTVRYYPEKQNIRIIDKTVSDTDYSGIYEYIDE